MVARPAAAPLPSYRDPVLRAVVFRFVLGSAILVAMIEVAEASGLLRGLTTLNALLVARLALLTGVEAWASQANVVIPSRILVIDTNCTAIYVVAVYAALVAAYPIRMSVRALGILVGAVVIIAANLLRLTVAAHVSEKAPAIFDVSHYYLYQVGLVMLVVVAWAAWLSVARAHAR
jgi:exosortase/archaeosortase family protein